MLTRERSTTELHMTAARSDCPNAQKYELANQRKANTAQFS